MCVWGSVTDGATVIATFDASAPPELSIRDLRAALSQELAKSAPFASSCRSDEGGACRIDTEKRIRLLIFRGQILKDEQHVSDTKVTQQNCVQPLNVWLVGRFCQGTHCKCSPAPTRHPLRWLLSTLPPLQPAAVPELRVPGTQRRVRDRVRQKCREMRARKTMRFTEQLIQPGVVLTLLSCRALLMQLGVIQQNQQQMHTHHRGMDPGMAQISLHGATPFHNHVREPHDELAQVSSCRRRLSGGHLESKFGLACCCCSTLSNCWSGSRR